MSSRSLAAARARRAGENAPPVSGNRPVTSISSQAAFAQQMPQGMGYNMGQQSNVRVSKSIQPPIQPNNQNQQFSRQTPPQYNQFYDKNQNSQPPSNNLPFSKLSISDAIGLITLRLGRVEQWIIETDHENQDKGHSTNNDTNIPDNHKIIDNSVLTTMINRLDSLEKNSINNNNANSNQITIEQFNKLEDDIKFLNQQFIKMDETIIKHTIELSKNTEQIFRFNRELTETKDILKTFMLKYDQFTEDTEGNFRDYENALTDLENRLMNEKNSEHNVEITENNIEQDYENNDNSTIMTVDLKKIIKQELEHI
jgi:hypothetical protein